MPQVYSERFIAATAPLAWSSWYVPAGKRAVIQTVTLCNGAQGGIIGQVIIGLVTLVFTTVQARSQVQFVNLRTVAYAGEQVGIWLDGNGLQGTVSGYLFDEVAGRTAPVSEVTRDPPAWRAALEPHGPERG